jgi:hypothetical protein
MKRGIENPMSKEDDYKAFATRSSELASRPLALRTYFIEGDPCDEPRAGLTNDFFL